MRPSGALVASGGLLLAGSAARAPVQPPSPPALAALRYDLRPGDRLVYRQVLEQGGDSPVRIEWRSQVLAVGERPEGLAVGFQRNRVSADVVEGRRSRDRLAEERAALAERLRRRPAAFAEANLVGPAGWGLLPWSALREAGGELLPFIRELPALPLEASTAGAWRGDDEVGFSFRVAGRKAGEGAECAEIEGRPKEGGLRVDYSLCGGVLRKLELVGDYDAGPGRHVSERVTLELVERRRGEEPSRWLAEPETRHGALAALPVLGVLPKGVTAESLLPLLAVEEAPLQRRVLAAFYRLRLPAPPVARLEPLLGSADPRVRTLAVRVLGSASAQASRSLLERAGSDADAFVRDAAQKALRPQPDPALTDLAQRVRSGQVSRDWRCEPGWSEAALRAQQLPGVPPGDARDRMRAGDFAGRLFVLHVPEDYRGDEPFPLLIVLGGGPGRALSTAQGSYEAVDPTGYLVLYPHAYGFWWDEKPAAAVRALLQEALGYLNVDVNRVYLTGFSNGGTGTFLYAARWPDRLAAAAPLMGAGLLFLREEGPSVANLIRLPMLFIHGDRDDVIEAAATRETVKALRKRDPAAPVEEVILPGRGHDVRLTRDEGRTLAFFEGRRRDPFPRRVTLEARTPEARSYWLAIAEKDGGMSSVEGSIGDDNTLRLTTRRVKRVRLLLRRELLPGPGPLRVTINGRQAWQGALVDDCRLLQESWRLAGDPFLAHGFELSLDVPR